MENWIYSIITPDVVSHDPSEIIMLIGCSRNFSYYVDSFGYLMFYFFIFFCGNCDAFFFRILWKEIMVALYFEVQFSSLTNH